MMLRTKSTTPKGLVRIAFIQIVLCFMLNVGYGQTYISPQVDLAHNTISNDFAQYIDQVRYKEDFKSSYLIGVEASHRLSNKIELNLNARYERLELEVVGSSLSDLGDGQPGVDGTVLRRFHYGFGFDFDLFSKVKVISRLSLIHTASTTYIGHIQFIRDSLKSNELESNIEIGFSYQFKSLSVTPLIRYGFWHNDSGHLFEIDPIKAVGIRIGYRFKVLNKAKAKNKVACPKV